MTIFINQMGKAPIFTDITKNSEDAFNPIQRGISNSTTGDGLLSILKSASGDGGQEQINSDWSKWFNNITTRINSNNYYGNPSELLNGDFNWNSGINSPITQASGDGAHFSERWQVQGAAVATYSIGYVPWDANSSDQIGSIYYIDVNVTSFGGGIFYLYQRQTGSQYLRRIQNRRLNFSVVIENTGTQTVQASATIFLFLNPDTKVFSGSTVFLSSGQNQYSTIINTSSLSDSIIGANPYVEYRLNFLSPSAQTMKITYFKVEIADTATVLYIDHAIERLRINNFVG